MRWSFIPRKELNRRAHVFAMAVNKDILWIAATLVCSGCVAPSGTVQPGILDVIEGESAVVNGASVDIYPVIRSRLTDQLGGVGSGSAKVEGFCQIAISNRVVVDWAEKEFDGPRQRVSFLLPPNDYSKVRSIEFKYHGNGRWDLNLHADLYRYDPDKVLYSIRGQTIAITNKPAVLWAGQTGRSETLELPGSITNGSGVAIRPVVKTQYAQPVGLLESHSSAPVGLNYIDTTRGMDVQWTEGVGPDVRYIHFKFPHWDYSNLTSFALVYAGQGDWQLNMFSSVGTNGAPMCTIRGREVTAVGP